MITSEELIKIVSVVNKTTWSSDPFPSKLLIHFPTIIDIIMYTIFGYPLVFSHLHVNLLPFSLSSRSLISNHKASFQFIIFVQNYK